MSKFYTIHRNNSGGYYMLDEFAGMGHYIIIEANSVKETKNRLEQITEGFTDYCVCCGKRWDNFLEVEDGKDEPMIWEKTAKQYVSSSKVDVYIHKLDGSIEKVEK